jgi:predicted MFS family arabinose efflux permease
VKVGTTPGYTARTWLGLAVLCLGAGVILLNMASLSPLLKSIGKEFGTSDAVTGQLSTVSALIIVVSSLVATPWMDRWSRRTWLQLEGSLLLVGVIVSAVGPSFGWLVVGRIIAAAGAALIMANCLTGARELFHDAVWRNRAIGLIISATTLALIVGLPVMTQLDAIFGWRVALASIALPVLLLLAGTIVLPSSPRRERSSTGEHPLSTFRAVLGNGRTRCLLVMLGLNLGLYTGWLVYFGAYVTDVFAVTAGTLSALFFLSGVTEFIANNLTPPLLRRFDPIRVAAFALTFVGAALLLTGIAITTVPGALVAAILILNGTAAAYVAGTALLLDGEVSHPGAAMALTSASTGIGNALGPFITGWALATSGSFEVAYRILGLFAPVAIVTLWLATRRRPVPAIEASQSVLG